jgi:2-desacetyl-2-hydroxyethyl bacteriochlorophyllide A dehydrogenase
MIADTIVFSRPRSAALVREKLEDAGPGPQEVMVRAEASLLSNGTELAAFTGRGSATYPTRPGYSMLGRVERRGVAVRGLATGDRVLCFGNHSSLQLYDVSCRYPWATLLRIGDDATAEQALVGRMARIAGVATERVPKDLNEEVVVVGLGLVGVIAALLLQHEGRPVVGLTRSSGRRAGARAAGVRDVRASDGSVLQSSAAAAIDSAGTAGSISECVRVVRKGGVIVMLGTPRMTPEESIALGDCLLKVHRKSAYLVGAHEWGRPNLDAGTALVELTAGLSFVARHLDATSLVTHRIEPEAAPATYERMHNEPSSFLGVQIDWMKREDRGNAK